MIKNKIIDSRNLGSLKMKQAQRIKKLKKTIKRDF